MLGSANVDETLRGYFTKYDCSSADLNPIGGISKKDLCLFVESMKVEFPMLQSFLDAKPTAELEPITLSYTQNDEDDMGVSYHDLSFMGTLRKFYRCGPLSMFYNMLSSCSLSSCSPDSVVQVIFKEIEKGGTKSKGFLLPLWNASAQDHYFNSIVSHVKLFY